MPTPILPHLGPKTVGNHLLDGLGGHIHVAVRRRIEESVDLMDDSRSVKGTLDAFHAERREQQEHREDQCDGDEHPPIMPV